MAGRRSGLVAPLQGFSINGLQPGAALRFTPGCHMTAFQA